MWYSTGQIYQHRSLDKLHCKVHLSENHAGNLIMIIYIGPRMHTTMYLVCFEKIKRFRIKLPVNPITVN